MLDSYLAELEKIKLLSPEEERALWQAYKEHDDESARTALIEHYQPLVFREAMAYYRVVPDVMDCVQEGTVGLIEAVERFDYAKGVAFSYMRSIAYAGVSWITFVKKVRAAPC